MSRHIEIPYSPRPLQKRFHEEAKRFSVAVCHRRFGKTVMAINHLCRVILTSPLKSPQGAYIAPTYQQAKRVAWAYFKEYLSVIPGVKFNESALRIDLPTGAKIWLLGSENPDALRGMYLDYAVLDEYADMNPRLFPEVVRPALADRKGGAMWIGTPRGHNAFFEVFERARREMQAGNPDWYACLFKASETGYVAPEELEDARGDMEPEQYEQEFECSFTAAIRGAYYGKLMQEAAEDNRIGDVPWEQTKPVHTAWDLGVGDSTGIWFYQDIGRWRHYIDFYEASGEGLLHYAKVLSEKPYVWGEHVFPHDVRVRELGSGKSRYEVLGELGIRCNVMPKLPVQDGIEAARVMIRQSRFDAGKCEAGLNALRQYRRQFDPVRREFRDRPFHDWTSNAADSYRMSALHKDLGDKRGELEAIARSGVVVGGGSGQRAVVGEYDVFS